MVSATPGRSSTVGRGTYWSFGSGRLLRLREEGVLPGPRENRWLRIPAAVLLLVLGPLLGLLFVMCLPVAGIVLIVYLPLQALWQKLARERGEADLATTDSQERAKENP